ncbi:hypothetical protein [Longispora albida]|uniref:hypothetical protein n=1 Tax=Longispora albida TaxID=203523 RepID=UPI000360C2DF|nr:hypothetical protein [Longispora albida]
MWRNHRLHHYRNEHYWFTVTTSGTADRVLGAYPDQQSVSASPTAKNLHGPGRQRSPGGQVPMRAGGGQDRRP